MRKKISILVGYHKPAYLLPDSDIFIPIQLGRSCVDDQSKDGSLSSDESTWLSSNTIGDNTGDNISQYNREFCELTGLYWAWKNYSALGNPKYFGFMHYRRHFILRDEYLKDKEPDFCHMVRRLDYGDHYLQDIGLDSIDEWLDDNQIIVCRNKVPISPFAYHMKQEFIDKDMYTHCLELLRSQYPEIKEDLNEYLYGKTHYWSNVFICSKEIFFELCDWIFPKLFFLYEKLDFTESSVAQHRFIGYLAENLFGVFWQIQKSKGKKVVSRPLSFVENTDIEIDLSPYFNNCSEAIVFSCDDNYPRYLATSLQSIISHSSEERFYDIFVLTRGISQLNLGKLKSMVSNRRNFSLRFVNVQRYTKSAGVALANGNAYHYTEAIYYRYFIPKIFKNFKRAIYLDCDVVFLDDVGKLFDFPLEDKSIAAVKDIERRRWLKMKDRRQYTLEYDRGLGIANSREYFNSGLCIFNIPKLKNKNLAEKLLQLTEDFNSQGRGWYGDQDILNSYFYGDVAFISEEWNVMWVVNNRIHDWNTEIDAESCSLYKHSLQNAKMIHYCDQEKPWRLPTHDLAHFWWIEARKTPFYEECLSDVLLDKFKQIQPPHPEIHQVEQTPQPMQERPFYKKYLLKKQSVIRNFAKTLLPDPVFQFGKRIYWRIVRD